jgi:hypothetical protein
MLQPAMFAIAMVGQQGLPTTRRLVAAPGPQSVDSLEVKRDHAVA